MPLFSFFKRFSKLFKTVPPVHKLGVSYSVWDGEEMLEFAIRSIRSEVDYVNVVWQKLSWFGTMCSVCLNHHAEVRFSTCPLNGTVHSWRSKPDMRSVVIRTTLSLHSKRSRTFPMYRFCTLMPSRFVFDSVFAAREPLSFGYAYHEPGRSCSDTTLCGCLSPPQTASAGSPSGSCGYDGRSTRRSEPGSSPQPCRRSQGPGPASGTHPRAYGSKSTDPHR